MSPIQWAFLPLKKYAQFSGRAPRAEFWWYFLFLVIVYFGIGIVGGMLGAGRTADPANPLAGFAAMGVAGIFMGIFWLAVIIPTTAVQVRRLHDINRSGWWVGGFWIVYILYMAMFFSNMGAAMAGTGGSSGMMMGTMVLGLVIMIYSIVLLVLQCLRGTQGPNDYGPDPYGVGDDVGEVFA